MIIQCFVGGLAVSTGATRKESNMCLSVERVPSCLATLARCWGNEILCFLRVAGRLDAV